VARKKKQSSNIFGWAILAVIAFGIYQFGVVGQNERSAVATTRPAAAISKPVSPQAAVPLSAPRYVNVAELNVRHLPNTSGPLVMTLPRGTPLRVLDRKNGWLLIDINPTLEGWVSERLTTTEAPNSRLVPPAEIKAVR
jgi:SH3-like domain-containing protein